jgi:hypothetical protein
MKSSNEVSDFRYLGAVELYRVEAPVDQHENNLQ